MDRLTRLLNAVLAPRPAPTYASLPEFRAALYAVAEPWFTPLGAFVADNAILGGALADRLGYAFAAGYAAAVCRLVPRLPPSACLCVTEAGGNAPRAIRTTLEPEPNCDGWILSGEKAWATLAGEGDVLLVAASEGTFGGRNRIRLVRVPGDAPGIAFTAMPETPFTPEIPHYAVTFTNVHLPDDAVLPGDGYARYVKPFRTVEDIHVSAAAVAYLTRVATDNGWPDDIRVRGVALLVALRGLSLRDPTDPGVHIVLAGCLALQADLIAACAPHWASADPAVAARWHRDLPLLQIAERARAQRLALALSRTTEPVS